MSRQHILGPCGLIIWLDDLKVVELVSAPLLPKWIGDNIKTVFHIGAGFYGNY